MKNKLFNHNDYELIQREILHQGIFRLARYHLRHRLFNGGWSPILQREVVERLSAAAVLPYDPVLDSVVLIEQFRPAALANPSGPWLIEIVAGVFKPDEKPEAVAYREAIEEADCPIEALYPIQEYFSSPGGSNEYVHVYCGKVDTSTIGGIHGLADENEDIRALVMPLQEALDALQRGQIKTSPAIIALQWLQINHLMLKKEWGPASNQE